MGDIRDSTIGGGGNPNFPDTSWSVLECIKGDNPADAASQFFARYWKPVYSFIRLGWGLPADDAKDRTQEFFLFLLESEALKVADPERGRFRAFLKTVLRNFLTSEHRKAKRVSRGGREKILSMDVPDEEFDVPAKTGGSPEDAFDQEWARALISEALGEVEKSLTSSGRAVQWKILEDRDMSHESEPPGYVDLAKKHGISENQVSNYLQETRRKVRDRVILKIREYALDEDEIWEELNYLLGLWNEP